MALSNPCLRNDPCKLSRRTKPSAPRTYIRPSISSGLAKSNSPPEMVPRADHMQDESKIEPHPLAYLPDVSEPKSNPSGAGYLQPLSTDR
ncbi:hypothetical protein BJY00DRAFT_49815 [Aspergillus carlsbadensis]|nr:hypothetical protein BJY00DRAFT_49815 [Aspergillus carlsbadensis]